MNEPIVSGREETEGQRTGKRGTRKNPGVQKQFKAEDGSSKLRKNNFV
jgi:hypothetical protein